MNIELNEKLFDLVAPIAIYHGTDVCFKEKACKAFRKLKRMSWGDLGKWVGYVDLSPDELNEDGCGSWAIGFYNNLFRNIVYSVKPNWEWAYDEQGCRYFFDENNQKWFSGDNNDCFAWYETAALIKERIGV